MLLSRFSRGRIPDLTQAVSGAPSAAHTQGAMLAEIATASSGQLCPGCLGLCSSQGEAEQPLGYTSTTLQLGRWGLSVNGVAFLNAQGARVSEERAREQFAAHQEEEERRISRSGWEVFLSPLPYPTQGSIPGAMGPRSPGLPFGLLPILLTSL